MIVERKNWRHEASLWVQENPEGWAAFERFALEIIARGRKCGVGMLRERVRWETNFQWGGEFKFNNCMSPYIARMLMEKHPKLKGLIKCRRTNW